MHREEQARPSTGSATEKTAVLTQTLGSADAQPHIVEPLFGARLGRFILAQFLGEGASGRVYLAHDTILDRAVAIKLLGSGTSAAQLVQERLLGEARALARLSHTNVVQIYDVGVFQSSIYLALEYIDGVTLRVWQQHHANDWRAIVAMYCQCGEGLAAAHKVGLVHRDFKPENVMVSKDGRAHVLDFGLASLMETSSTLEGEPDGQVEGTPGYMAPEQYLQHHTDARSDQFSFCVALYEAFFGGRPFGGRTLDELRNLVVSGQFSAPPSRSEVPHRIRRALLRGLAREPRDRWPNMDSLLAELATRPARKWVLGLAGVLVTGATVGALAVALPQAERCTGANERVAAVWNQARRETLQAGLVGTRLPFAAHAAGRVTQVLDDYAADWAAMSTEACQTHQRGEQSDAVFDRRVRCLERRRADLGAMIEVLGEGGKKTVEEAVTAATSLPPLSACADAMALMDEPAPPAELRARIEATRAEIGRSRANRSAGNAAAAHQRAERALVEARATGYQPLIAEALDELAEAEGGVGRHDDALKHGSEAFQVALAGAQDVLATKIATDQMRRAANRANFAVGETWVVVAQALLERGGFLDIERVRFYAQLAVLYSRSKPREACEVFTQAQALAEKHAGPEVQASIHMNFGNVLLDLEDHVAARAHYERAIVLREAELGADHPLIIHSRGALAAALGAAGETALAEAEYRSAIELCGRARGAMHWACSYLSDNLAVLLVRSGRYAEARPLVEQSLRFAEARFGPRDPVIVFHVYNVGYTLLELGELAEAHAHMTRALAIQESAAGPESVDGARFLLGLGRVELDLARPAVARPLLERALALRERLEVAPGEIAEARFHLARALWSTPEDRTRAIELGRQAEAVLRGVPYLRLPHAAAVAWLEARDATVPPGEPPAGVE